MFWPNSYADEAGTEPARQSCGFQQPNGPWGPSISGKVAENYSPHPLCVLHCKLPAALYFRQVTGAESAFAQWLCQYVGGGDSVLNSEVDPDASNRRHGMCRITLLHL
jgi:hypothetical protein